jgi:type II secretion system protein N
MVKRKRVLFFSGVVLWGVFVTAVVIYLFFPYQRALKIALHNVVGGSRTAVSLEGVSMKIMGVRASRLSLQPEANTGRMAPFELSKIDISWNPLSLVKGKLVVYSRAVLYGGVLRCTVDGVPVTGPANPDILLKFEHVDIGKAPEGALGSFKGITGILDGVIKKEVPLTKPDKQVGSFRLNLKAGEIRDLQIKNLPRLIIPYKEIFLEGKMDGTRIDLSRIAVNSEAVSLKGNGVVETGEMEYMDLKLSYESLSPAFPLKGKGIITIRGNRAAPDVTISGPDTGSGAGAR